MPNRFDELDFPPAARTPAGQPEVPISRLNRFDEEAVREAPAPSTLTSNAADFLKAGSNTFSMGMRDRLAGATDWLRGNAPSYSEGVNQQVADSAMRRERSPMISAAGDVAGGVGQAFVPGVGATGRSISAALGGAGRGIGPIAARTAGYGIEGGLLGAGQAAGGTYTGNPQDYANAAMTGGAFGALVGAPFGKFADVASRSAAAIPNSRELKAASTGGYDATHSIPVAYSAPHFWGGLDALEQQLFNGTNGAKATNRTQSGSVFDTLDLARAGRGRVPPGANATVNPQQIDSIRQQLTGVNEPGAGHARRWLDSYMQDPTGVVRGTDAQRAEIATLLNNARGNWRAGKRTETVENTNQYADDRAPTANSGANSGNTYRQKLVALLNPKSSEGKWFNASEKDDIRQVTSGAAGEGVANTLRSTGNFLKGIPGQVGAGGGVVSALATGDLTPLLATAGYPIGSALKGVSNRMTRENAAHLENQMAMRSPLYRDRAASAPVLPGPGLGNTMESGRNAITNQIINQLRIRGYMDPEGDANAP
jgi:hypothetical protein